MLPGTHVPSRNVWWPFCSKKLWSWFQEQPSWQPSWLLREGKNPRKAEKPHVRTALDRDGPLPLALIWGKECLERDQINLSWYFSFFSWQKDKVCFLWPSLGSSERRTSHRGLWPQKRYKKPEATGLLLVPIEGQQNEKPFSQGENKRQEPLKRYLGSKWNRDYFGHQPGTEMLSYATRLSSLCSSWKVPRSQLWVAEENKARDPTHPCLPWQSLSLAETKKKPSARWDTWVSVCFHIGLDVEF